MKRVYLLLLVMCLPAAARAMQIQYKLETLVQLSDVIVVGTLRDVSGHTADGTDYGQGRIEVREVIWGRVSPGDSLLLKWDNRSDVLCPRVEHGQNAGREGVWLLTRDGEAVRANYAGSFVQPGSRGRVERALAGSPVVLRKSGYLFGGGRPMTLTLVYRNASDSARSFPGVEFEGGRLRLSKGSALVVTQSTLGGHQSAALSEQVVADGAPAPLPVEARGERRVDFDLRGLLAGGPKAGDSYTVSLKLAGQPPTNDLSIYVGGTEAEAAPAAADGATPEGGARALTGGRSFAAPPARGSLTPFGRAGLAACAALALFPALRRLRSAAASARLSRAAHGAHRWQI